MSPPFDFPWTVLLPPLFEPGWALIGALSSCVVAYWLTQRAGFALLGAVVGAFGLPWLLIAADVRDYPGSPLRSRACYALLALLAAFAISRVAFRRRAGS
jgi:hypothetical protein